MTEAAGRARTAGILLGVGMGGFVDGIVLHQVLQWHHMLSTVMPPTTLESMRTNMSADGIFHLVTWGLTLGGIFLLWDVARRPALRLPTRWFGGFLLVGWGIFNLVEGLVDHHLLGVHHLRGYAPSPFWDYGFLLSGVVLIGIGAYVVRQGVRLAHSV